jgi:hypothetical protein
MSPAIISSGGPKSVEMLEFKWTNTIISNVKNSLRGTFHSIGENIFPASLLSIAADSTGRYNLEQMVARFGYVAVRTAPMPQRLTKVAKFLGNQKIFT